VKRDPLRPPAPPHARVDDPRTSAGLVAISRKHGALTAVARAVEHTMATGIPSSVNFGFELDYARLSSDAARDPRTPKQIDADAWIKQYGPSDPMPKVR
jgi:hypothetical protein